MEEEDDDGDNRRKDQGGGEIQGFIFWMISEGDHALSHAVCVARRGAECYDHQLIITDRSLMGTQQVFDPIHVYGI